MANWNLPVISSTYVNVLEYLRQRDDDAVTLVFNAATNLPEHAIRFDRTANVFQEWLSGVWVNKVLAIAGGGTGATSIESIKINLGLGSMAYQHASSVAITGGTINGVTLTNSSYQGTLNINGGSVVNLSYLSASQIYSNDLTSTPLNASQLVTGTVPTPRLGSGTANSTTFLRGDQVWTTLPAINPSRWTHVFVPTHQNLDINQANNMTIFYGYSNTGQQNLHLPSPSQMANPAAPVRIISTYGTVAIYGGHSPGPYVNVGGRPSPFMMPVPYMSVDLVPNANNNEWNVF